MTPKQAAEALGLTLPTSYDTVQAAFRAKVKANHPDLQSPVSDTPFFNSLVDMDFMRQARDVLVDHIRGVKPACSVCGGSGVVRKKGFKPVGCPKGCKVKPLTRQAARRKT